MLAHKKSQRSWIGNDPQQKTLSILGIDTHNDRHSHWVGVGPQQQKWTLNQNDKHGMYMHYIPNNTKATCASAGNSMESQATDIKIRMQLG